MELLNNIIEKEAAAGTYMYNCPPKGDAIEAVDTKKKSDNQKKDNEGQKVKKMYEDMMEQ